MSDDTEAARRELIATGQPLKNAAKAVLTGEQTWTTAQLQEDFEVLGFAAPFVVARRRSDGRKGSLEFSHSPRIYFGWTED